MTAIATDCYKNGSLSQHNCFFCAIAIEEHLSAIYEIVTKKDIARFVGIKWENNRVRKLDLNKLIDWQRKRKY